MGLNRGAKQVSISSLTGFLREIKRLRMSPRFGAPKIAPSQENIEEEQRLVIQKSQYL